MLRHRHRRRRCRCPSPVAHRAVAIIVDFVARRAVAIVVVVVAHRHSHCRRAVGAIDEEIDSGGTTDDRAGGRSTLWGLSHPVGLSRGMTIAYAHRSIDSSPGRSGGGSSAADGGGGPSSI